MVRRPLIFAATGFAAAIITGYYAGTPVLLTLACGGVLAFIFLQKQLKPEQNAGIIAVIVLISYGMGSVCFCINDGRLNSQAEMLMTLADETGNATVEGRITDVERKSNSTGEKYVQATVKTEAGSTLVKFYDLSGRERRNLVPGRKISVSGQIQLPQGRRNPGCFDYALYLKSQGIATTMTGESFSVSGGSKSTLQGCLFLMRESYIKNVARRSDRDTANLFRAIMFGDKGEMDQEVLEVFQRNGTAHILAVSGLHIGIIYGFLVWLWRWKKGWIFFCFIAVFFFCYAALAGFSPSVVRAVLMVLLHSFAFLTGRRYDLANAAFLVAIFVMADNPFMLFNAGFQMSFLAVLTMALVLPFVEHIYTGVFLSSLVIQIGLGPFIIYNFNYLSLIAVFINVPVIFLAGIIVPLGLVNMLPFMPEIFYHAGGGLCSILKWINEIAEVDGLTTFQVASPPLWLMAFYYLGLLTMATEEGRLAIMRSSAKAVHIITTLILVLIVSLAFSHLADDGFRNCDITFVDVGQGDCMHVRADGRDYLIDGGGSENYNLGKQVLRQYLLKNGASHVDGAFVTHLHTDHYRGICELAQEGMVDRLYVYEGYKNSLTDIEKETGLDSDEIIFLHAGQSLEMGDDATLEIIWPQQLTDAEYSRISSNEEDENAMSLIMKINIDGVSTLATGDIDEEGEGKLVSECPELLATDILKVAHHGSKYSSSDAFLDAVDPGFAVIQVGKNNYGHPTAEVLEKLALRGVPVYRNDLDGAVGVEIKKGEVRKIRKMIK